MPFSMPRKKNWTSSSNLCSTRRASSMSSLANCRPNMMIPVLQSSLVKGMQVWCLAVTYTSHLVDFLQGQRCDRALLWRNGEGVWQTDAAENQMWAARFQRAPCLKFILWQSRTTHVFYWWCMDLIYSDIYYMIRPDMIWYLMIWYDIYNMLWYDITWYDMILHGMIWHLTFYLQCDPRLVSMVEKQITDSTYVCLPHLDSGQLFYDLGSRTFCSQVFCGPCTRDENQVLFLAQQPTAVKITICPQEFCGATWCNCQVCLLFHELPPWSPQSNCGQRDLGMQRWLGRKSHIRHQRPRLLPMPRELVKMQSPSPKRRPGKNRYMN